MQMTMNTEAPTPENAADETPAAADGQAAACGVSAGSPGTGSPAPAGAAAAVEVVAGPGVVEMVSGWECPTPLEPLPAVVVSARARRLGLWRDERSGRVLDFRQHGEMVVHMGTVTPDGRTVPMGLARFTLADEEVREAADRVSAQMPERDALREMIARHRAMFSFC
jgi:hypothetical protein